MIRCAIIENDPDEAALLSSLIQRDLDEELKIVGTAYSATEGLDLARHKSPELIFLDIELSNQTGFYLFTYLFAKNIDVVFTSSNNENIESKLSLVPTEYLIKPYNIKDLWRIINLKKKKAIPNNNDSINNLVTNLKMGASYQEKIALPTADGFQVIHFNEILYCQASENYSYINTVTGDSFLVTKTLKGLEELLPSTSFFRIHKSILLNINYVKSFSRKTGYVVFLENGQKFEVATRRQEEFSNLFLRKTSLISKIESEQLYSN